MDSSKGYSVENCVVCCKRCNLMKGCAFSYIEFMATAKLIHNMRGNFIYPLPKESDLLTNK